MKSSGWRLKAKKAPFQTLAEFSNEVLRHDEIDLICFSDHLCEQGFVSAYLRNAATLEDYGGGTLTIDAFHELRAWVLIEPKLNGRRLVFSGKLKQKAS